MNGSEVGPIVVVLGLAIIFGVWQAWVEEPVSVPIAVALYLGTSLGLLIMAAGAIIYAHTFLSL